MHGGKSTGPRTKEGALKSAMANLLHGMYAKAICAENKAIQNQLLSSKRFLEDMPEDSYFYLQ